jgi:tetratricopeptide (TPR) repeat protein
MRYVLRWFVVVAGFLGALLPAEARADRSLARPAKQEARERLTMGNRLYNAEKWDDAIREYKAGAQVEDAPVFDYNIAQCLRRSGAYQEAMLHYARFLDRGQPTGEVLGAVQAFISEMRAQLGNRAKAMPPTEPVKATDATAQVPTPRDAAQHRVDAVPTAPGTTQVSARDERRDSSNWLGWTTTGLGVGAIGVSGYLLLRAASLNDQSDAEKNVQTRSELRDGARTRNLIGAVTAAGGLALTVTGVILLATHGHDGARPDAVSLGITPHGVLVLGRF